MAFTTVLVNFGDHRRILKWILVKINSIALKRYSPMHIHTYKRKMAYIKRRTYTWVYECIFFTHIDNMDIEKLLSVF